MAPIEWLDHAADIGFRVVGSSVDDVFEQAARGLFTAMVDVDAVVPVTVYRTQLSAPSLEDLMVKWLSDLVAQKEITGLVFGRFRVHIEEETAKRHRIVGDAWGEPIEAQRHHPRNEVKGISYLGLKVEPQGGHWMAQVIVDV